MTCSNEFNQPSSNFSPGYQINWDSEYSLKNWISDLNLRCKPDWLIGLFGSLYFFGFVFGITFTKQGDTVGRIVVLRMAENFTTVFYVIIIFLSRNIYVYCVMIFLTGICTNSMVSLSYIYGQETVSKRYLYLTGALYNTAAGLVVIFSSLYFKLFSKNWFYLEALFFALKILSNVLVYIMPESPKYLIEKNEFDKAKEVFNFIAKINGKPGLDVRKEDLLQRQQSSMSFQVLMFILVDITSLESPLLDESNSSKKQFKYDFLHLVTQKEYSTNLISLLISWSTVSLSYYMISVYMKYLPGDIYTNMSVSAIADVVASLSSSLICSFLGLKQTFFLSFALCFLTGMPMVFLPSNINSMVILVLVLITKFGISCVFNLCYLAASEYFPVLYRSSIFGVCNMVARSVTILAPMIAEIQQPYPMLIYSMISLISAGTSLMLRKPEIQEDKACDDKDKF